MVALISCPYLRLLFRNSPLLLPRHSMAAEEDVVDKERIDVDFLQNGTMVVVVVAAAAMIVDADHQQS